MQPLAVSRYITDIFPEETGGNHENLGEYSW
jgi:hypothetical protein